MLANLPLQIGSSTITAVHYFTVSDQQLRPTQYFKFLTNFAKTPEINIDYTYFISNTNT